MSFYEELDAYMKSVRLRQGGSSEDTMLYEKVTGRSGDVALLGPYGIRSDEWGQLAEQAGISGANWRDKSAQEAVVRHQFTRLYNQYGGRWDAVSVAWKAGEEVANRVINDGNAIDKVVAGDGASVLQAYVNDTMLDSVNEPDPSTMAQRAVSYEPFANAGLVNQQPEPIRETMNPRDAITNMLTSMRDKQVATTSVEGGETDGSELAVDG